MDERSYQVSLLGKPSIHREGLEIKVSDKQLALVALIHGSRTGRRSRKELSKTLWPKVGSSSGRHSLSQAIYVLKQQCPGLLIAEQDDIVAGQATCDIAQFHDAVSASRFPEASALYRGPFMEGLEIADSTVFSHWKDGMRERLSTFAEQVAEGLAVSLEWQELDRLTQVLLDQGRQSKDILTARVAAVLHHRGEAEAKDVIDQLPPDVRDQARKAFETISTAGGLDYETKQRRFVGRTAVLERLVRLHELGMDGQVKLALITGEAGIGKTALMNRLYRVLALKGARTLMANAHAAEANVPFGVVEQWLGHIPGKVVGELSTRPWMTVIQHVFPALGGIQSDKHTKEIGDIGYHRLVESLRQLIVELSTYKPLVLGIDDMHLADSASVGLLHYLLRRTPPGPALVVGTMRTESNRDHSEIAEWEAAELFDLRGLSVEDIENMVGDRRAQDQDSIEVAEALHRRTGGNPLLVKALLDENSFLEDSEAPPQSVIDFYRPRILSRSLLAQRLLAAVHLVGVPVSLDTLAEIAGLSDVGSWEAVRELEVNEWIYLDNDNVKLGHDLLGQVALSLISGPERKRLHGRAARVLAEEGRPSDARAAISHDLAGNQKDAFDAAMKAVDACETLHARSEKEFFLKLGLSNAPTPSDAGRARVRLAELFLQQQKPQKALAAIQPEFFAELDDDLRMRAELVRIKIEAEMTTKLHDLRQLWNRANEIRRQLDPLALAETYVHLAGISHDLGFDKKSLEIAQTVASELSNLPLTTQSAQHLLRPITIIGLNSIGYEGSLQHLARLPSPNRSEPLYACSYYSKRGSVLVAAARLVNAEADFANSLGIAERYALFDHYFYIHNNLGVCLMECGRYAEAERHFERGAQFADSARTPGRFWILQDNLMILEYERGKYSKALDMAIAALRSERVASSSRAAMSVQSIIGLCSLAVGAPARSKEAEREIKYLFQRHDPVGNDMSYVHIFLARMRLFRDDPAGAISLLTEAANRYRALNALAYARLQLERCRISIKSGYGVAGQLAELDALLHASGAVPLIDDVQSLMTRA